MALKLPPLGGLRLFEAAARCGTFKQAAMELNLTPGALSHGIDALEQSLQVELFERKGRRVELTSAGRQYLPYVSEALAMIATGTLRLPSRRFESRLAISSTGLFLNKVLLPRLHKFRETYPKPSLPWTATARRSNCPPVNTTSRSAAAANRCRKCRASCLAASGLCRSERRTTSVVCRAMAAWTGPAPH